MSAVTLVDLQPLIAHPDTKVVPKKWGTEYWLGNTPHYCGKLLSINKGFRCSEHFHKFKSEMFVGISGEVILELPDVTVSLGPGDRYHIHPGMVHRFTGKTDALILEVSSFHADSDSYRLSESGKAPEIANL